MITTPAGTGTDWGKSTIAEHGEYAALPDDVSEMAANANRMLEDVTP
jgi:hypothetical protein